MADDHFDILLLIARPAAGKSEIIDYLKHIPDDERVRRFHVGPFVVLDDFPMLWAWFEEDDILQKLGCEPLHTISEGYFKDDVLWHVLIERLSLEYAKLLRDRPDFHARHTVLIEFSRGAEHGGYKAAFAHFSEDILRRTAVLYVEVSYEESLRKNRRRFNPNRADSILEHGLPDAKLERLYREDDFADFSAGDPDYLIVGDVAVPYVVFPNDDDVTTGQPDALPERLEAKLGRLWELHESRD
jgi:hypothetical protein